MEARAAARAAEEQICSFRPSYDNEERYDGFGDVHGSYGRCKASWRIGDGGSNARG